MRSKAWLHSIISLLILSAFCTMVGIKTLHHHTHHHGPHELVCVLDGECIHAHKGHSHPSVIPYSFESEEHCAICQFQIVKVCKTPFRAWLPPVQLLCMLRDVVVVRFISRYYFSISSRAPPTLV